MSAAYSRCLVAEGLGTAFLLATVVGSGIMGERLADGNVALALLANALATGAILVVLILIFGPISGGHFNPAVTLSFALQRTIRWTSRTSAAFDSPPPTGETVDSNHSASSCAT